MAQDLFLGGTGHRAVANTHPEFPKLPTASSVFPLLGAPQAPGDEPNLSEGSESQGKAPWGRRKIFQSPSHTRPDPCLRQHGRPKWWIGARKPIWLPRAYLTKGDLEPARGNLHVCKFLRDLTNIQIRTVTAERANLFWVHLPDERVTTEGRKEGENRKEREKDGRKENEGESEREGTANESERGRKRSTQYALKLTTVSSLELIQESVSCCLLRPLLTTVIWWGIVETPADRP